MGLSFCDDPAADLVNGGGFHGDTPRRALTETLLDVPVAVPVEAELVGHHL